MFSTFSKLVFGAGIALFVSSCDIYIVDGESRNLALRYVQPNITPENGAIFRIGDDYNKSFSAAQKDLRGAGFSIISANAQTGMIEVASNLNATIDCGQMAVGENGALRVFDANSNAAAIEVPIDESSSFVSRQVLVSSTASISIGVDASQNNAVFASISESHTVNLSLQDFNDDSTLFSQTLQFSGTGTVRFGRGLVCGSARYVRATLGG